jgi:NADH-quinone oxidoreductase subunit J
MTVSTAFLSNCAAHHRVSGMRRSRAHYLSAFSYCFHGVAGLYLPRADFVAAVQVLIYVGGILVDLVCGHAHPPITDVTITNRSAGRIPALIVIGGLVYMLIQTVNSTPWAKAKDVAYVATTAKIGDAFLYDYLLPFELASLVLLAAMIGAVVISRKEIKE